MQLRKPPERSTTGRDVLLMGVQSLDRVEAFVSDTELRSSDAAVRDEQSKIRKEECALGMEQR